MAKILILEHFLQHGVRQDYILYSLADRWQRDGHTVRLQWGAKYLEAADIVFMNVDLTVTPDAYRRLVKDHPKVVNRAAVDISKRRVSRLLLTAGSDHAGPVIIKTNANSGGRVDHYLAEKAKREGRTHQIPETPVMMEYPVLASVRDVPAEVWANPALVVEKFVPEQDERGFYTRHWFFFGERECGVRYRAPDSTVRTRNMVEREDIDVPDQVRPWRAELGLDFGKIDYVLHDGRYELLDVARTPGRGEHRPADLETWVGHLAGGLDAYL